MLSTVKIPSCRQSSQCEGAASSVTFFRRFKMWDHTGATARALCDLASKVEDEILAPREKRNARSDN
jgi:hypothetical protein